MKKYDFESSAHFLSIISHPASKTAARKTSIKKIIFVLDISIIDFNFRF